MLHPSTKKLIDRLCEMTLQRKIDWVSGEQPDTLVYDTEGYRVLLDGNPAALSLCDALGNELERATQADIAATQHIDGGTYETVLETMRADASRIARGTEGAIASVLGSLDIDATPRMPEPAQTVLEEAPDGSTDDISDQIEDTTNAIGTLSTDMSDAYEAATDEVSVPDSDMLFEATQIGSEIDLPKPDLQNLEASASAALEDLPSIEDLNEGSEDIEKAVANLADKVNNPVQNDDTKPLENESFSGAATAALAGGAALVGGAILGQGEENTQAEPSQQPDNAADVETPQAVEQAEPPINLQQAPGFISLSGLASGNNGFVTPVITDTTATDKATPNTPVAETIEATPGLPETIIAPAAPDTPSLSAETIEGPDAPTPEDEIITKLDEFIAPEPPAETAADTHDIAPEIAPEYSEPEMPAPVSPADLSSEDLVEAPVAPPAPEETETEAQGEEKSENAPNKRFNPWI